MHRHAQTPVISRRTFLATTSAALVGAALGGGLTPQSEAAQRHPQRGGVLEFGTRNDPGGLDSHRQNQNHASNATSLMYTGLTDIDQQGNIVPASPKVGSPTRS